MGNSACTNYAAKQFCGRDSGSRELTNAFFVCFSLPWSSLGFYTQFLQHVEINLSDAFLNSLARIFLAIYFYTYMNEIAKGHGSYTVEGASNC